MAYISQINGTQISASFATSASYTLTTEFANTSSYVDLAPSQFLFSDSGDVILDGGTTGNIILIAKGISISGGSSLNIEGPSINLNGPVSLPVGTYNITSSQALTASFARTASFVTSASIATSSSFAISSSFATTASYVLNAVSASYVLNAVSASYVLNAVSASYVLNAVSASFSQTSSTSTISSTSSRILVTDTTSGTGPYYITFTDGTTGARTPLIDSVGMTFNATTNTLTVNNLTGTASFATSASIATSSSFTTTASYSEVAPLSLTPTFLSYTSVATASSNTALQSVGADPVQSNAGFIFPSTGFYYFEFNIRYTSAAIATGAFFSLSGSAANSYLSCVVTYPTSNTDRSTTYFTVYDGGSSSPSTLAASPTQVNALITGHIRVTTVGSLFIRFATEIAGSAITFQGSTIMYRKISN